MQPAPALDGTRADGTAWTLDGEKGHWTIPAAAPAACDDAWARPRLYATPAGADDAGARHERLARVWLVTGDGVPSAARTGEHPDIAVVLADPRSLDRLPRGSDAIYLVDPLGNQVLAGPLNPDVRGVARDLSRSLKASRIG